MVTILKNKLRWKILTKSAQFRYALTYVIVSFVVLLLLNIYVSVMSHRLFSDYKEKLMFERCNAIAAEIGKLTDRTDATVTAAVLIHNNLDMTRLVVTDDAGVVLYDSNTEDSLRGQVFSATEVVDALKRNSVFVSKYHNGVISSNAAVPIYSGISMVGSVYLNQEDTQQGGFILAFQQYTLIISLFLELAVIIFSLLYTRTYSKRLNKISDSIRTIRDGNYSQNVDMGGNDELTVLGEEFNDLIHRLQISEEKRNHFVSDASHELNTPLASIKLLSDSILQNDMDIDTIKEFVGDIGNEADRLTRMSEKLLSLSRIEGELDNEFEIVYVAPTIERVLRMLSKLAEQKNITFHTDLVNDGTILIQEDDLYEIVFNLAENAIKYNVTGGEVYFSLNKDSENVILQVKDTGVGIPEDARTHIFERFFRVDKARSRKSGGSGLGLSIVRNMVERNNGEIQFESTVGSGTTFTLFFPVFETE